MLLNISWAAKCVERSSCYKSICTQCKSTATVLKDALGLSVNDAHKNRNAVVNNAHSLEHNLIATLISCKNNLARRAEEEQAIHASFNKTINGALKRHNIKLMVWGIWGYNWWNNTAKWYVTGHALSFHTLENPTSFIQQCTEVADQSIDQKQLQRTYVIIVRLVMTKP